MPEAKIELIEHDYGKSVITEFITRTYNGTNLVSQSSVFGLNGKLAGYFGRYATLEEAKVADDKRVEMAG